MQSSYRIQRRQPSIAINFPASVPSLLQRVYAARGIGSIAEINYSLHSLMPPLFNGMPQAVALLQEAVRQNHRILIVGDYDADGATSTVLAVRALRAMGGEHVDYLVPNRFEYGYGLSPEIVEVAKVMRPQLLITVDNGISSIAGVAAARASGIKVLITDHHLPGTALPQADAILNPNLPDEAFPSKALAGVGVVFYAMLALRSALRDSGWFAQQQFNEPNLAGLLDLVALGTVADVVPLDYNNRILVEQGLRRIRAGECLPGIKALLQYGKTRISEVRAADLAYAVGPRLNAAGRLDDMAIGIECLLSNDEGQAQNLAALLDRMNTERREIERKMEAQALHELERFVNNLENDTALPAGVCCYDPCWHQGVIGILASRIKDRLQRPVIAFAPAGEGELKGSGRSVSGFHLRDALDAIASRQPGLIEKFGGHAMAAGLSLSPAHLQTFQQAFAEQASQQLGDYAGQCVLYSDGELLPAEFNLHTAELLRQAGPWGQAFPEPLFDGVFEIVSWRVLAERHLKLQLRMMGVSQPLEAIAFNRDETVLDGGVSQVRLLYSLDVNEYNNRRNLQLLIHHLQAVQ